MGLAGKIALRYLFSKKSSSVINWISGISAAGMAVGTAALILILSVYNGFDRLIRENLDKTAPDIRVTLREGKNFDIQNAEFEKVANLEGVISANGIIEETVAVRYGAKQTICRLRGEPGAWECSVSAALANELGIKVYFFDELAMYYPSRSESFSMANPTAALESVSMRPKAIIQGEENLVIVPISKARELLHMDSSVNAYEIWSSGVSTASIKEILGSSFEVKDRMEQNSNLYKMMRYEKAAIFLILVFIVFIVAFNIFGSLSMLIIEKKEDIDTLRSLGAGVASIRRIFFLEGWMVSLLGLAVGILIGVALALLQQYTGIVRMPGNYLINSYPVNLQLSDVILSGIGVSLIGAVVSSISIKNINK